MAKGSMWKALLVVGILAAIVYFLSMKNSYYAAVEQGPSMGSGMAPGQVMQQQAQVQVAQAVSSETSESAQMLGGVASGLLPKEPVNQEDFGSFSAESILSGQNFLDPRAQIGYPETVGGTLRNANLQLRSEPPNPREPISIFNLSTIVPDTMRPAFEIGSA